MSADAALELVSRAEAARRLGVGVRVVRCLVDQESVPLYRVAGGRARLRFQDVVAAVERSRVAPSFHARARVAEILEQQDRS